MVRFILLLALIPQGVLLGLPLETAKSTVEFVAVGNPSQLKIHGKADPDSGGALLKGNFEVLPSKQVVFQAEFELKALKTGISLRDRHMHDKYLETSKYPKASLSSEIKLVGDSPYSFKGMMKLHGVEKEVEGLMTINDLERGDFGFEFNVDLSEFGIEIPSFMGVTVAETVVVSVDISLPRAL